ncbi:MAG: metallopeptidase family protein [Acidimicrobiia bacterium]|nr:metallopeptidase family protein [Acidimicrobiia bacterium]
MDNVAVVVEDRHPTEELLGLYEGIPLTLRETYGAFEMPDKISIYRLPLCEVSNSEEQLISEIETTVVHEIAHHFGIDDDTLQAMGWG